MGRDVDAQPPPGRRRQGVSGRRNYQELGAKMGVKPVSKSASEEMLDDEQVPGLG